MIGNDQKMKALHLPALLSAMGTWTYYISSMSFQDLSSRVSNIGLLTANKDLSSYLQRTISDRSKEIAKYLDEQPQRFFNTIVIGVYGGNPDWRLLKLRPYEEIDEAIVDRIGETFGILSIYADTILWAIDGQHRVDGIRQALDYNSELRNERVSVIFVGGVSSESREDDEDGYQRTRRLFTTLNKHAKPVSKKELIALDEDDVIAVIVRRLLDEYKPLKGRINYKDSANSIAKSDKSSFTNIITLYDVIDIFHMKAESKAKWTSSKNIRPDGEKIELMLKETIQFMDILYSIFLPLQKVLTNSVKDAVSEFRNEDGGHLIFRPIGLKIIVGALMKILNRMEKYDADTIADILMKINSVNMNLSGEPWKNLLWDHKNRRMLINSESQKLAIYMLIYLATGNVNGLRQRPPLDINTLRLEYSNYPGVDISAVDKFFGEQI